MFIVVVHAYARYTLQQAEPSGRNGGRVIPLHTPYRTSTVDQSPILSSKYATKGIQKKVLNGMILIHHVINLTELKTTRYTRLESSYASTSHLPLSCKTEPCLKPRRRGGIRIPIRTYYQIWTLFASSLVLSMSIVEQEVPVNIHPGNIAFRPDPSAGTITSNLLEIATHSKSSSLLDFQSSSLSQQFRRISPFSKKRNIPLCTYTVQIRRAYNGLYINLVGNRFRPPNRLHFAPI